jgi:hypothetical protein
VNPTREAGGKNPAIGITMREGLLQEAMRRLSIMDLWCRRGWAGKPGKSCHFPGENRDRRSKASCSIFTATTGRHAGLQLLKDHKAGKTYDAPGLLAEVEGLSIKDACRHFIELAGVKPIDTPEGKKSKSPPASKPCYPPRQESPKPPPFDSRILQPRELDADEVEAIATTRGVNCRTIERLAAFGVIHAVTLTAPLKLPIPRQSLPMAAWAMHTPQWDSFRLRPFCGQFPGFGGRFHKSLTPTGGGCGVPVWIGPENAERALIVEGEGDAIGAVEIARRERKPEGLAVIVMFSASIALHTSFLPRLHGRRVRIAPHCGDSKNQGIIAAVKWAACCRPWAAAVEIFDLSRLAMPDGRPVTDLGDLARCTDDVLNGLKGVTTW